MSGHHSGPVCSSSERVRQFEDLQFSLSEGPCRDAFSTRAMVAEPDLAGSSGSRWPNYAPAALDVGARAVFAFPLQVGGDSVGALTVYNDVAGMITDEQAADGRMIARMLPVMMSSIQTRTGERLLAGELSEPEAHRAEVHQASGVVAVQLRIGIDDAEARIRAHAYVTGQSVAYIAGEILAHRLYLTDDQRDPEHPHD